MERFTFAGMAAIILSGIMIPAAHAGGSVSWSITIDSGNYHRPAPVYSPPAVAVFPPPVIYVQPQPPHPSYGMATGGHAYPPPLHPSHGMAHGSYAQPGFVGFPGSTHHHHYHQHYPSMPSYSWPHGQFGAHR